MTRPRLGAGATGRGHPIRRAESASAAHWGAHLAVAASPLDEVFDAEGVDPVAASLFVSAQVGVNAGVAHHRPPGVPRDGHRRRHHRILRRARRRRRAASTCSSSATGTWRLDALVGARHPGAGLAQPTPTASRTSRRSRPSTPCRATSRSATASTCCRTAPAQIVYSGHTPDTGVAWADLTRLQQRELTAHFVSGWTRDRLTRTLQLMREGTCRSSASSGRSASSDAEAVSLMTRVVAGELAPDGRRRSTGRRALTQARRARPAARGARSRNAVRIEALEEVARVVDPRVDRGEALRGEPVPLAPVRPGAERLRARTRWPAAAPPRHPDAAAR